MHRRTMPLHATTVVGFLLVAIVAPVAPSTAQTEADLTPNPDAAAAATDDAAVEREARDRIRSLRDLTGVAVAVDSGTAILTGEVATVQAWRQAEDIVGATDGVTAVVNEIEIAGDVLGQVDALRQTLARAGRFAPVIGFALAVLVLFLLLAWLVGRWSKPFEKLSPNRFVQEVAQTAVRGGLVLTGIVLALHVVDATAIAGALIGTAGVAGIAVGFAFKDLIENYLASVLLSLRQPFAPNDHVDIDGFEGKVVRLTSRATVLMTLDGNHVRIPNARVFKGVIINYTRNPRRRFELTLGIAADADLVGAQELGVEVLRSMPDVLDDPEPWSWIVEVGDSSVPITYYGWVDQSRTSFVRARSEAIRLVKERLESEGIELPEPIYRVRTEPLEPSRHRQEVVPERPRADLTEHGDPIVEQIDAERQAGDGDDLLDPSAPRE